MVFNQPADILHCIQVYPTTVTAIQFDLIGTARVGKYVINHSLITPGLVNQFPPLLLVCSYSSSCKN
jgi:anaerobic C4-dicarboxylate transporter